MSLEQLPPPSRQPGSHRQRLRIRVLRRYRIWRWRRAVVGLSILVLASLLIGGAVWGGVYLVSNFHLGEHRPGGPTNEPAPAVLTEPRLIGVWQSDADANLEEVRRITTLTPQDERELRKHAFKTKVTYTDKMMATETDRAVEMQPYHVVAKEGDEVVIRTRFNLTEQDEEFTIRFVGRDMYWADAPQFKLHECFRRIRDKPEMK